MDYWYELVKSYDYYKNKDPTKRDDGTYSQFSVVMLLIYLAFGKDYSTHIATYFSGMCLAPLDNQISLELVLTGKII
jgi:hypothetical protein